MLGVSVEEVLTDHSARSTYPIASHDFLGEDHERARNAGKGTDDLGRGGG